MLVTASFGRSFNDNGLNELPEIEYRVRYGEYSEAIQITLASLGSCAIARMFGLDPTDASDVYTPVSRWQLPSSLTALTEAQ